MTAPLIAIVGTALKKAIEAAEEATVEINQVFLNGTWAPTFLKIPIERVIPGKLKNKLVVPEEATVVGCAKQTGWILAKPGLAINTCSLEVPVSPITIGLDDNVVLIPMGSPLPARKSHVLTGPSKLCQLSPLNAGNLRNMPSTIALADLTQVTDSTIVTVELSVDG